MCLQKKGKRILLFSRRYFGNYTLDMAILSADGATLTNVLLGAAVTSNGAVFPRPSNLAKYICEQMGLDPAKLAARGSSLPEEIV